jgi:hypothetical protein
MHADAVNVFVSVVKIGDQFFLRLKPAAFASFSVICFFRDDLDRIDSQNAKLRHLRSASLHARLFPAAENEGDVPGFDLVQDLVLNKHFFASHSCEQECPRSVNRR